MMTEKEKMLCGELFDPDHDEELLADMQQAKILSYQFNTALPSDYAGKETTLRQLLGATDRNFHIEPPFGCDYGYNIRIGENFYANMNCIFLDDAPIDIGDNVFIGPQTTICTVGHPLDTLQRRRGLQYAKAVHIGNDVWIGAQVTVLPGVSIGNNVVIGAGSVVTHDIPDNVVAFGNPCRVQKVMP